MLLDAGAEPNAQDKRGNTALRIAKQGGFSRTVDLLRGAGARTD